MRRSNTSDANGVLVPPTVGWIASGLTVAALWVITYATLFPFDFVSGSSIADAVGRFRLETGPVWELRAVPANVALFRALRLRPRRRREVAGLVRVARS